MIAFSSSTDSGLDDHYSAGEFFDVHELIDFTRDEVATPGSSSAFVGPVFFSLENPKYLPNWPSAPKIKLIKFMLNLDLSVGLCSGYVAQS